MRSRKAALLLLVVASQAGAAEPELREHEADEQRWEEAMRNHLLRTGDVLRQAYNQRLHELNLRFGKALDLADKEYRSHQLSALQLLKEFLAKYPNDPKWTPDAMFRLADLYLDQAKTEFDEKELAGAAVPAAPLDLTAEAYVGPDFTLAIGLWRDIIRRFPSYRQVDSSVYLLAYYLGEMRHTAEAKQAYLGLVCHNRYDPLAPPPEPIDPHDLRARLAAGAARPIFTDPYEGCEPMKDNPDLIDEAWVRVGEAHFDTPGELDLAIACYKRAASNPGSKFYDIALYKLAWSYYRNDQFMEGIRAFDQLVAYSDKQEDAGGQKNDLRGEAIQYLAISFSEAWDKDALPDPVKSMERIHAFYNGRTHERHVRDVYEQLGDTLRLSAGTPTGGTVPPELALSYNQAIAAWRFTLEHWPLHPRNPVVHQKIVDSLAYLGDQTGAAQERANLAEAYRKGGPWYVANETNREAMEYAGRLGEQSLLEAARTMHRSAQLAKAEYEKSKTPVARADYLRLYASAADLYDIYLTEYPATSEGYELTYRLADCLFFSEQYARAVPFYRWVRDHKDAGNKYYEASADSIVKAYEAAVEQAKARGSLAEPPLPTAESLEASPTPFNVPQPYRDLQAAYDEYATLIKDDPSASKKALASAMISYKHVQLDDAMARFTSIMDTFCKSPEAAQAKEGLLAIYQSRGDNEKFRATNEKFISGTCGSGEKDIELAKSQNLSNDFVFAGKLFKDGKFLDAGQAFYAIYRTSPEGYENRPLALFNAALAYGNGGKPKTAISLYQEFLKVPHFESSEYYIESLFRTAASYQNAFDYDSAVDLFMKVVDEAGKPGRKSRAEFDLGQARLDAMWNAASLRDLDRVYYDRGKNDPGAATLYRRYAQAETRDRKRAGQAYFNAALVYEKAGNTGQMIQAFQDWKKAYGGDPGSGFYRVLAQYKTAKALEKERKKADADSYYRATIKEFDESGERPGSDASELAAEAQFWLAEQYYKATFDGYKVVWPKDISSTNEKKATKAAQDTLAGLQKVAGDAAAGYKAVARFQASWALAAIVRLGDVSFFAGQKLVDAPVPKEIIKLDQQFPDQNILPNYQATIEQLVQPQTDEAKDQWLRAVLTARQRGVANEWSKLAQQRLNAYIAADIYPVQRDEMVDREVNP